MEDSSNSSDTPIPMETIGTRLDAILEVLKGCSGSERLQILRAAGGVYNLRVMPAGVAAPPTGAPRDVTRKPKAPRALKGRKSPEEKAIRARVKMLNISIKEKSAVTGDRLPEDDPLIIERAECFRSLKGIEKH